MSQSVAQTAAFPQASQAQAYSPKACLVQFLGAGKYSDVFKVKHGQRTVVMKLSYYRDDTLQRFVTSINRGDVRGARRAKRQDAIAVAAAFSKLTAQLVEAKVSPHFVMVYCDSDCKQFSARMSALLPERLKTLTPVQLKYNNVCLMEIMDCDLTKYLTRGRFEEHALRGLVFQVVYTLAALQEMLPGFRHNDLSTNNVLVKKLPAAATIAYTFGGTRYVVPSMRVLAALSDYDFTHVPGHPALSNERVLNGRYRVDGAPNASYDSHFFLKSVLKCLARRRGFQETRSFLARLDLRVEDRQDEEIPSLAPAVLLRDPYFRDLISSSAPAQAEYSADGRGDAKSTLTTMPTRASPLPTLFEAAGSV